MVEKTDRSGYLLKGCFTVDTYTHLCPHLPATPRMRNPQLIYTGMMDAAWAVASLRPASHVSIGLRPGNCPNFECKSSIQCISAPSLISKAPLAYMK
jgi:hypothetical protein